MGASWDDPLPGADLGEVEYVIDPRDVGEVA